MEVRFLEWGLPKIPSLSSAMCSRSWDSAYKPAAGVIQVDVPLPVQAGIFGGSQFVQFPG